MAICGRLLQKPVNQLFWDPVRKHVFKKKKQSLGEEFGFPLVLLLHMASSFFLSAQAAHGSILLILKAEDVLPLMLTLKGRETVDLTYPKCGALFKMNAHSGTFYSSSFQWFTSSFSICLHLLIPHISACFVEGWPCQPLDLNHLLVP